MRCPKTASLRKGASCNADEKGPAEPGLSRLPKAELSGSGVALDRVLHAADGILDGAGRLIHLAFGLELAVARKLAGEILHGALRLVHEAFSAVLIHFCAPLHY